MISPAGCCHYRVVLRRGASGALSGRAEPNRQSAVHPGICGDSPHIELADDTLVLRSTWSQRLKHAFRSRGATNWGPPASDVRLQIGGAFQTVARDGDELQVARGGTAEIAVALFRGDDLQLAVGALAELDLRGAVVIEEDPRVKDQEVYGLMAWLTEPGRELLWLNTDDGFERALAAGSAVRAKHLVVAIAGKNPTARRQLNQALAGPLAPGIQSRWFIDVDARFTGRDQWLEYVRGLPRTPPPDLWVKARVGEIVTRLQEGEYTFAPPWHLHLVRVARRGIPGRLTQLAVARENPALTREIVVRSTDLIARGGEIAVSR